MKTTQLTACCGISVFYEFGNTATALVSTAFSAEEIKEFLIRQMQDKKQMRYALCIAAINDEQNNKFGYLFNELNWTLTGKFFHPNHNSFIFLYYYPLQQ